jgi:hypothetical protein
MQMPLIFHIVWLIFFKKNTPLSIFEIKDALYRRCTENGIEKGEPRKDFQPKLRQMYRFWLKINFYFQPKPIHLP